MLELEVAIKPEKQATEVAAIRRLLEAACQGRSSTLFPALLITVPRPILDGARQCMTLADLAMGYFAALGLRCDRTTKNLHGYPGMLRDLMSPPPWVEITPEDLDCHASEEQRPLYLHANETPQALLLDRYRKYRKQRAFWSSFLDLDSPKTVGNLEETLEEALRERLALARCLGVSHFEALLEVVFEFDEFTLAAGLPDLFVWSEEEKLWFFVEAKGPGDSLRPSQCSWIRSHWEKIGGRFALALVHAGEQSTPNTAAPADRKASLSGR